MYKTAFRKNVSLFNNSVEFC